MNSEHPLESRQETFPSSNTADSISSDPLHPIESAFAQAAVQITSCLSLSREDPVTVQDEITPVHFPPPESGETQCTDPQPECQTETYIETPVRELRETETTSEPGHDAPELCELEVKPERGEATRELCESETKSQLTQATSELPETETSPEPGDTAPEFGGSVPVHIAENPDADPLPLHTDATAPRPFLTGPKDYSTDHTGESYTSEDEIPPSPKALVFPDSVRPEYDGIPPAFRQHVFHAKSSLTYQALQGIQIHGLTQKLLTSIVGDLRKYIDLAVDNNLIDEACYIQECIDNIRADRSGAKMEADHEVKSLDEKLREANLELDTRRD
jgi:hypothetical protein